LLQGVKQTPSGDHPKSRTKPNLLRTPISLIQALKQQQTSNQAPNKMFSLDERFLSEKRVFGVGAGFQHHFTSKDMLYMLGESSNLSRATIRVASLF